MVERLEKFKTKGESMLNASLVIMLVIAGVETPENPAASVSANIFDEIEIGKQMLRDLPVQRSEALLAVQTAGGAIYPVYININPEAKGEGQVVSHSHPGFSIRWPKLNGVNTSFEVVNPSGCRVLALKRVLKNSEGSAVYVPYTKALANEQLQSRGLLHLENAFSQAESELRHLGVLSKAYPDKMVVDVISTQVGVVLSLIEHIDPDRFQLEPIDGLVKEVLTILGANTNEAYKYALSPRANARGVHQFIERSYLNMVALYPEAQLNPDFVAGMDDHVNASKAAILLMDSDLLYLKTEAKKFNHSSLEMYLAASYNGGAKNALKAIDRAGKFHSQKLKKLETRIYVKKYAKVREFLNTKAVALYKKLGGDAT